MLDRVARLAATSVFVLIGGTPALLAAQDSLDIGTFSRCDECLVRIPVLQLGNEAPPGVVRHDATRVEFDPVTRRYAMWVRSLPEVALFSEDGAFQELVLPRGDGPGEVRGVTSVRFQDGALWVLDAGSGRVTSLGPDSVSTYRAPPSGILDFAVVDDELAFLTQRPGIHPFVVSHLDRPADFRPLGPSPDEQLPRLFWSMQKSLAPGGDRTVWFARYGRLRFEQWGMDGTRRRVVGGEPDWFPAVYELPDGPPASRLYDFVVDDVGRIWVMSGVADRRWREGTDGAGLITDRDLYLNLRVDVFDPDEQSWSGPITFDSPLAVLFLKDGTAHMTRVIYDDAFVPRAEVSRLEVRRPPRLPLSN